MHFFRVPAEELAERRDDGRAVFNLVNFRLPVQSEHDGSAVGAVCDAIARVHGGVQHPVVPVGRAAVARVRLDQPPQQPLHAVEDGHVFRFFLRPPPNPVACRRCRPSRPTAAHLDERLAVAPHGPQVSNQTLVFDMIGIDRCKVRAVVVWIHVYLLAAVCFFRRESMRSPEPSVLKDVAHERFGDLAPASQRGQLRPKMLFLNLSIRLDRFRSGSRALADLLAC